MSKDKSKDGLWHYEVPQQNAGAGAVQSNAGRYAGGARGGDSQEGDFLTSPPEANAMPPGAAQTSRGSAGRSGADPQVNPVPGAGGSGGGAGRNMPDVSGGASPGSGGAGDAQAGGAGGGEPAPVGNGTKDEPVWGS